MVVSAIDTSLLTADAGQMSPIKDGSTRGMNRMDTAPKNDSRDDDLQKRSIIKDEQVTVNLAMADLMAYLQVVANNSNNLPLTRRDDPELTRMVTNLSSEEYAKKSAAFIPADVRVIAGSFLKYGNVWDLPTSEEYVASDGAQEPGRSYGGACSNSMLKVLYDAASEAEVENDENACDALFDDEDDESLATMPFTRNSTFASLDMNGQCNPSTISWAELLRKMKTEIRDIEYAQVPAIGATRKFDLSRPFSLVPENFDKATGKKRSLLIGCNYNDIEGAELKASHDDVKSMKDYIVNVHGFPENDEMMTVLIDDGEHKPPTFMNIVEAFKALSEQSQPGDSVFIQFSGHGGRILDSPINNNVESYDEIIVPSDYSRCGVIRDTLIFKTLLAPMRYGVCVTLVLDSCDTGMMLDLPYSWSTRSDKPDAVAKMKQNEDFSYVRFLKVVKTLYESSTFTQLGRTVGTALGEQPIVEDSSAYGDERTALKHLTSIDRAKTEDVEGGLCTSLCNSRSVSKKKKQKDANSLGQDPLSIIEKVFGCNFLIQDFENESFDEDTFANVVTFDESQTFTQDSTFDTFSDDDFRQGRRSRQHKR